MKKIVVSTLMMLLIAGSVYAEPSKLINNAMSTPASVFDLFLYQLENKCNTTYVAGEGYAEVDYFFEDNLIGVFFYLSKPVEGLKNDLINNDKKNIEKALRLRTDLYALQLGVIKDQSVTKSFEDIKIRRGWEMKDFDEEKFKDEVKKRIILVVTTRSKDKIYVLKRSHDGEDQCNITDIHKPAK